MEAWLKIMGFDAGIGARLLGITDEQMSLCLSGDVPRHIALACSALYHRLDPWDQSAPGKRAVKVLQKQMRTALSEAATS